MGNKILGVLRFEIPFERDRFRFNLFATFRERTFKQVEIRVLSSCVNQSYRGMTNLEKHV